MRPFIAIREKKKAKRKIKMKIVNKSLDRNASHDINHRKKDIWLNDLQLLRKYLEERSKSGKGGANKRRHLIPTTEKGLFST